jgi:hypothetical protein
MRWVSMENVFMLLSDGVITWSGMVSLSPPGRQLPIREHVNPLQENAKDHKHSNIGHAAIQGVG